MSRLSSSTATNVRGGSHMNDPQSVNLDGAGVCMGVQTSPSLLASEIVIANAEMQDPGLRRTSGGRSPELQAGRAEMPPHPKEKKFRYRVTLNAPTAMIKSPDEIPVTYLNKGEAYSLSIIDTTLPTVAHIKPTYRTCVRICFDDIYQRHYPAHHWHLWKEKRGAHPAYRRGGRLQAIELYDPGEFNSLETPAKAQIELDSASIDGFVVKWSPIEYGPFKCFLTVRFNGHCTDSSHPGDIRGGVPVPLRLYVKTEMTSHPNDLFPSESNFEICYCKVKVFIDRGAEQELLSDVAHVKNKIFSVKRSITGYEPGSKHSGKRKRDESGPTDALNSHVDDVSTHDRVWPTGDKGNERQRGRLRILRLRLAKLQDQVFSTRPASILFLEGDKRDDPDLHPVLLSDSNEDLQRDRNEHAPTHPVPLSRSFEDLQTERNEYVPTSSRLSPASAGSYSSRASSPPRASSIAFDNTKIMPSLIPFEDYLPNSVPKPPWALESASAPPGDEYRYLPLKPDDVRLLALIQGTYDEDIHCSLKIMPISRLEGSQLGYQALSYAWGDEPASEQVFLQDIEISKGGLEESQNENPFISTDQAAPRRLLVRSNLYAALKRLRSETEDLWFWIDALSINQNDDAEKSHQLPKMLDIFCNAWNVCIWLGEAEPVNNLQGAHDPLDFISTIVNLKLLDRIVTNEDPDEETAASFVAFANLLRRAWFRRRWVIQEVAASKRASVQCGDKKINWIDFADAVQLFLAKLGRIRALYATSKLFQRDPDALAHVESMGAGAIVRATDNVLRKTESGKVVARLWNIEFLVSTFVHFEASDPRDTIYALLPLASDGHLSRPETTLDPDYSKSTLQIYAEFVQHCVRPNGCLDIICRHWAPMLKEQSREVPGSTSGSSYFHRALPEPVIPSWIGLVTNSAFGPSAQPTGRLNGDSFVGEPGRKVYNASRGRFAVIRLGNLTDLRDAGRGSSAEAHSQGRPESAKISDPTITDLDDQQQRSNGARYDPSDGRYSSSPHRLTLYAKGVRLAPIRNVSPRTIDGIIPYDGLKLAGWVRNTDLHKIPDHLWRLLVADRASDGSKAPSWWRRACMYCLSKTSRDGDLNTTRLVNNSHSSLPETVLEYLRRVQAVTWNRKFFACTAPSLNHEWPLGLGPGHVQEGDWACILFGCSVPVVLRERRDDFHMRYFEFIGECYLYGMMDGEAIALPDEKPTDFTMMFNIQ